MQFISLEKVCIPNSTTHVQVYPMLRSMVQLVNINPIHIDKL